MNAADPGMIAIQAIKRPVSERRAFLESACAGDVDLRGRVEELIKAYEESGRFSVESQPETQTLDRPRQTQADEGPGARIGHYKLLQQIGEGGFGVVYMAEQTEPVRRKVALKVVKPGMDTGEVVARFEAERQALALMDHPNIARVLDAGATRLGRPFFVMELVRGVSITEYCDKNNLATRDRLQLFTSVCHAVQHAHQKGVIHRDLKPSNILVTLHDGQPVPKVIDFGVAKALHHQLTQRTLFTAYGQVVGTPQYMSPEQAEMSGLDIDTRSDIYSLGVLLYELLTGSTPFDGQRLRAAGFAEMLRIIREEEPPKPSTRVSTAGDEATVVAKHRSADPQSLCQQLRGELDWIVIKALDKDRNRRYANANGLAADLWRYLHDEPVSACPPSAAYRLRKFARRNKKMVAAAVAIGAVLLGGALLSAVMAVRAVDAARVAAGRLASEAEARADAEGARQAEIEQRTAAEFERDRALDAERRATRQRNLAVASEQKAQANFEQARDTVDRYLTTASESQLLTVPGMQPLRQRLLDSALTFYERFVAERQDNVQLRAGLASAYLRLGEVHSDLREQDKAEADYAKAQEAFEALVREGHDAPEVLRQLGTVYFWQGRYAETVALCKRALDKQPDNRNAQLLLASTYNTLAINAKDQGDNALEALRIHRDALAIRRRLVELEPDNPKYLGDLSSTINNIGVVLGSQRDDGHDVQALNMFRLAREYVDAAFARAPYSMLYGRFAATSRRNVAIRADGLNLQEEALSSYRAVVDAWNLLAINNPTIASYKSERYKAYQQLAGYQQQIGQQDEAAATLRLARQSVENLPQDTADDLYGLAKVYAALARSRGPEQEAMAQRAVRSLARAAVMGYSSISAMEKERAFAKLRQREDCQRLLAVLKLEQEISKVYEDPEKREDVERIRKDLEQYGQEELARIPLARALRNIADFYVRAREFDEARTLLERAASLLDGGVDDPHATLDLVTTQYSLGQLYWDSDRRPSAHKTWQRVMTELANVSAEHSDDEAITQSAIRIERQVCDNYGGLGLWQLAAELAVRNVGLRRVTEMRDAWHSVALLAIGKPNEFREYCKLYDESYRQSTSTWKPWELSSLVWQNCLVENSHVAADRLIPIAREALRAEPETAWLSFALAMALYRNGQYSEALETVQQQPWGRGEAPTQNENLWFCSAYLRSMLHLALGQSDRAREAFSTAENYYRRFCQESLQHADGRPVRKFWWWQVYPQQLRAETWRKIHGESSPDEPWQRLIQARGYLLIGEVEKAVAELAAATVSEDADLLMARARLLGQMGRTGRAEADWQKIIDLAPDDPMPWIHRGRWYAEQGQHEKADADFAKAASLTPNELNKFLEAGWWVLGPYPANLDEFCPPEIDPDPARPVHVVDPQTGLSHEPVSWSAMPTGPRGSVPVLAGMPDNSCWYAMAYLYADEERTARIDVFSTTKVRLWVNGQLLGDLNAGYRNVPQHMAITLRSGRNLMLLKAERTTKNSVVQIECEDSDKGRAYRYAKHGLWQEAAELVAGPAYRDLQLEPIEWTYFAPLLLLGKAEEDYNRQWSELYERDRGSFARFRIAMLCAIAPDVVFEQHVAEIVGHLQQFLGSRDPKSGPYDEALLAYALIQCRLGELDEASSTLSRVRSGWGTNFSHAVHAMIAHARGASQVAEESLAKAIAYADRTGMQGNFHRSAEFAVMLHKAETVIRGTTLASDELLQRWREEGMKQLEMRDPHLSAYEEVIFYSGSAASKVTPNPFVARGKRLAELGRVYQAEADFNKAVELKPDDPQVLLARAVFYADNGETDKAAADFRDALILSDAGTTGRLFAGLPVNLEVAQRDDVLDRLEALRPDDGYPRMMRMIMRVHQGQLDAATRDAERLEPYGFHRQRASVALLRGDEQKYAAIRAVTTALTPKSKLQLLALAPTEGPMGAELLAISNENWSAPDTRWHHRYLGLAQFRAGKLDEAVATLEASLDPMAHWPTDAYAWPLLAMAHHQLGNRTLARKYLDKTTICLELYKQMSSRRFADAVCRGTNPVCWLMAVVFYREAKLLIDGPEALAAEEKRFAARRRVESSLDPSQRVAAYLQRLVDCAGDDPLPWIRRARWYTFRGKHEKAVADCTKAIELDPDNAQLYVMRGSVYLAQERTEQAKADFDKAQELAPDDPAIWSARGEVHEKLDQWDKAIADYGKAIELAPDEWPSWKARAEQFAQSSQGDKAIALYAKIIEHNADNEELWQALANAHIHLQQQEQAAAAFSKVVELKPEDAMAWWSRGNAYFRNGDYDKAIADFNQAIGLDPTNPMAYKRRGQAHAAKGEFDLAIADHSEAIRLQPNRAHYYRGRAEAYFAQGDLDRAIKDLERVGELGDQESRFHLVVLLVTAGDTEGYRLACARLYEQFGQTDDPKIADWLAWICIFGPKAIDDLEHALEFARRAVASDPGSPRYHNNYAGVLYRAGRYQEAADELIEAVRLRGGEGSVRQWIWLAMVHHRLGNGEEARQWLDKARSWIDQSVEGKSWVFRIGLQLLRREAEELMNQTPEDKKAATDGEDPTDEERKAEDVKSEP